MTAVEEIQTAIDNLAELKAGSSPGPWELEPFGKYFNPNYDDARILHAKTRPNEQNYDRYVHQDGAHAEDSGGFDLPDAALIVTLHRTIDAQLGILSSALSDIAAWTDPNSDVGWEPGDGPTPNGPSFAAKLALARAINGVTS
jgi:hypothetical protein